MTNIGSKLCISVAIGTFALSGCASTDLPPLEPASAAASGAPLEYTLDSGDSINLVVYGEPELTGRYTVLPDGTIQVPLLPPVQARGLTSSTLPDRIETALRQGILRDPRVSVNLAALRPFYIYGEVANPGAYPYQPGMTVPMAVALAGGYKDSANRSRVVLKRKDARERQFPIVSEQPISVLPDDVLRIPERSF